MKKLLALLLALIMPVCASAETYGLSVSVSTDEAVFTQYVKEALLMDPAFASVDVDAIASAMQQIFDGLGMSVAIQEDAMSVKVQMCGGTLLDAALHLREEAAYLTSSMLSGFALAADSSGLSATEQALSAALANTDRADVATGMIAAASQWASVIEPTTANGVFSGDAYEGGTQCTTWVLSDMDIAALVSALMTDELRAAARNILPAMGVDAEALLSELDSLNGRVADADAYLYMLRVVEDDAGNLIGISLTFLHEMYQVATVSVGVGEKDAKLVVGLGMDEQNYWWEFTASAKQLRNVTFLGGESREWIADKSQGFSYVSVTNAPLSNYEWHCNVTKSGSHYLWDASVYDNNDAAGYNYLCSSSGSIDPGRLVLDCSISLGASPYRPLTVNLDFGPVDAIAPLAEGLEVCSMDDPADAALCEKLTNQFTASILARLIKLLPPDVILTMTQFSVPE